MNDAEERFLDAARAFQAADELARSREQEVDDKVFKRIFAASELEDLGGCA